MWNHMYYNIVNYESIAHSEQTPPWLAHKRPCLIRNLTSTLTLVTTVLHASNNMLHWTFRDSNYHECLLSFNILRARQNGHHFPDDIFKCIFLNENVWILVKISLKFVPKGPINNIPALVQIMTSHNLSQWWLVCWRIYASLGLSELKYLLLQLAPGDRIVILKVQSSNTSMFMSTSCNCSWVNVKEHLCQHWFR